MTMISCIRRSPRYMRALLLALPIAFAACTPAAAPGDAASAPETSTQPVAVATTLTLTLSQPVAIAAQDDAAVYRGSAVAKQVCAQCHDIGAGSGPAIYAGAPTFISVIEKPETTSEGLAQWLKSSHPSMPHYMFNDAEVVDLVAYMMSLRKAK